MKDYIILNNNAQFSELPPFSQFDSTKYGLNILLEYMQDLEDNLKTLYSKLVKNNTYDHKSYDTNQWNLSYSALLSLYSNKISDCKL